MSKDHITPGMIRDLLRSVDRIALAHALKVDPSTIWRWTQGSAIRSPWVRKALLRICKREGLL